MSGDPSYVTEIVAWIYEPYNHVIFDAGRPIAMHVKFAALLSVINVEFCIDFALFTTCGPMKLTINSRVQFLRCETTYINSSSIRWSHSLNWHLHATQINLLLLGYTSK